MIKFLRKQVINFIIFLIAALRPLLGTSTCCIYPISCSNYAKSILQEKALYISIPLILWRLISCNPLTAIFWKIKKLLSK